MAVFFARDLGVKALLFFGEGDLMGKFKFNLSVWEGGGGGGISNLVVEVPPEVNGDDHFLSKNGMNLGGYTYLHAHAVWRKGGSSHRVLCPLH